MIDLFVAGRQFIHVVLTVPRRTTARPTPRTAQAAEHFAPLVASDADGVG